MSARFFSQHGKGVKLRRDATPLSPDELIRIRKLMRVSEHVPELDSYMESADVADLLGLHKRTVLQHAHDGVFDGPWGKAFKPSYNRVKIPKQGVQAFINRRAIFSGASADIGTGKGTE